MIMIRDSKQTRQATILHLGFCPIQFKCQWCWARLLKVEFHPHALTLEKRVARHCLLQRQIYSSRVMRMRFKKMYIHVVQKKMTIILVLQAVYMMKTENTGFSPQRDMMMLWKMDLKYRLLWPKIFLGGTLNGATLKFVLHWETKFVGRIVSCRK